MLAAPASAISDNVTLSNMETNENRVVILYVAGEYHTGQSQSHYVLTCNEGEPTCRVPEKGRYYHMETTEQTKYACPEVTLSSLDRKTSFGVYCLHGVH
jgi:hypothetical protein